MKKETKEERFIRVAEKRVQNILNSIRSLSQLANAKVYAWSDDQIGMIMDAVEKEITHCRASFEDPESRVFRFDK